MNKKIINIMYKYFKVTQEQAEFIKDLRVKKGYSWRAVARDMDFLKDNIEDGWN